MKNMAASVRERLAQKAKQSGRPFQEALQLYGLERFLYRLSQMKDRENFLLKGALMLRAWKAPMTRPTRDIDLMAYVDNSVENLEAIIRVICTTPVPDDGIRFDSSSITGERIKKDRTYEGVRVRFEGLLGKARIPMQIDIAFGDSVFPDAKEMPFPTLLDFPSPTLRTYPLETVIAEKFHAMIILGRTNSRMKDFFDIWLLSSQYPFDGDKLATAMRMTFSRRKTEIDRNPIALTEAFLQSDQAQKQWAAFIRRSNLSEAPQTLGSIGSHLERFLLPVADAISKGQDFDRKWEPQGPWNA